MAQKQAVNDWIPPVDFYFRVDFQNGSEHFKTSFMEVTGLNMQIETKDVEDDDKHISHIPTRFPCSDITLKRPICPLSDDFTTWVNDTLTFLDKKPRVIKTYDMVIKILDREGNPVAGWLARHTFPKQWSMGGLNSTGNGISSESIVMACSTLKRITNIR